MKGYLQVYTGNGKGKTTAAIGLAVRAAGAGLNVLFAQFVKGRNSGELIALKRLADRITVRQYGRGCFIIRTPAPEDIEAAAGGLRETARALAGGAYDLVVLDEACIALHFGLFGVDELLEAVGQRDPGCEVVVTGRHAPQKLIDAADLVTEMKEVKHYYSAGVEARDGIEQ
jgi:cob(I)alamin adenosyltransferase